MPTAELRRYTSIACIICQGAKCDAGTSTAGRAPRRAARADISSSQDQIGACSPAPGTARTTPSGALRSTPSAPGHPCGNASASSTAELRRSARAVRPSDPGARRAQGRSAREKRLEGAELLRDRQRRMVRQHDYRPRRRGSSSSRVRHVRDHDRRRRARDARHVVVLRQPAAAGTQRSRVPRQIGRPCCSACAASRLQRRRDRARREESLPNRSRDWGVGTRDWGLGARCLELGASR